MTSDRQGKQAALAMLACMAAVALTLWQWPGSTLRMHHAAHPDVTLPAAPHVLLPVPALPPAPFPSNRPSPVDPPRDSSTDRNNVASRVSAPAPFVQTAPVLEPPTLALVGERVSDAGLAGLMPMASRAVAVPMRPVVPERRRLPSARPAPPGNAFAHAGMALGSAFRRAGVNTGAAFSHIF